MPTKEELLDKATYIALQASTNILMKEAKRQVDELSRQKKHINQLNSSLKALMNRYFAEKSVFDRVAHWYGTLPLVNKAFLVLGVVTGGIILGTIFGAIVAIGTIGVSVIAHLSLSEHHRIETQRCKRFCEDINNMEAELKKQVNHLKIIEKQLHEVLVKLSQELVRQVEFTSALQLSLQSMESEIQTLNTSLQGLEQVKLSLQGSNEEITGQLSTLKTHLSTSVGNLSLQTATMERLNQQVLTACSRTESDKLSTAQFQQLYQERIDNIEAIERTLASQLELLSSVLQEKPEETQPHPSEVSSTTNSAAETKDFDFNAFSTFLNQAERNLKTYRKTRKDARRLLERVPDKMEISVEGSDEFNLSFGGN